MANFVIRRTNDAGQYMQRDRNGALSSSFSSANRSPSIPSQPTHKNRKLMLCNVLFDQNHDGTRCQDFLGIYTMVDRSVAMFIYMSDMEEAAGV